MTVDRALTTSPAWVTAAVAAVTFFVAYADGGYSLADRSTIAIGVWWTILVGVGLGVWRLERLPRAALAVGALLALFTGWTLASTAWAPSAEDAVAEFDRAALYLGIYVLVVLAADRPRRARWIDGLAVAISATGLLALASRLFPRSFRDQEVPTFIPNASERLSFPLGYWNGLGIFVALAVPLLLRSALADGRGRRLAAVGAIPALGTAVYLTSSRGAVVALIGGILVFVAAASRRWAALGAALAAAAGTAASIAVLVPRDELVNGPLDSAAARSQGWQAAILIVLICAVTAAGFEGARAIAARLTVPAPVARQSVLATAVVAVLAVGVFAAREAGAFQDFTRLPTADASTGPGGSVGDQLLRGGGSGRWQFWTAAVDEFRSEPFRGGGAGSYEAWWAEHGSFAYYVRSAHSVYLETLGELGLVGFLLLVGALAGGAAAAARRLRARNADRTAIAALLGAFATYLIGAGTDWMWELTVVTLVGMCALGLLTGRATLPSPRHEPPPVREGRRRLAPTVAVAVVAGALVTAEAIALLADIEVRRSQANFRAGSSGPARSHALAAAKIEPWAATPYLQLALAEEGAGDVIAARRALDEAIRRDSADWRLWLVAARIESRLGHTAAAARSLARARSLNPRSPVFSRRR